MFASSVNEGTVGTECEGSVPQQQLLSSYRHHQVFHFHGPVFTVITQPHSHLCRDNPGKKKKKLREVLKDHFTLRSFFKPRFIVKEVFFFFKKVTFGKSITSCEMNYNWSYRV